jgi:sec-independent protein translocase protein TatA
VSLGPAEILVILVIALLVFGPNRLPEIGRQVGRGVREFRKFQDTIKNDLGDVFSEDASGSTEPAPTLPPRELDSGVTPPDAPGAETESADPESADPESAEAPPAEPSPPSSPPA